MKKRVLVLLSGGVDSGTTLAIAKKEGFILYAITFQYGQKHCREVACAERIARAMGVKEHLIFKVDLQKMGGSALIGKKKVPKNRSFREMGKKIPSTYVPARNTIFLSLGLAWAEVMGIDDIFIGVHSEDSSGYPDCRSGYIRAFEKMANLATRRAREGKRLRIHTPLINLTKGKIIKKGLSLGLDYSLTFSCYDPAPGDKACGRCDSCLIRLRGFRQAGAKDPIPYV